MSKRNVGEMVGEALESSKGDGSLSSTVKYTMLMAVPIAIAGLRAFGVDGIDEGLLTDTIDSIAATVQAATALISIAGTTLGLLRKIVVKIKEAV